MKLRDVGPTAILEGFAVLVGVLLAFWVESAGQDRQDAERAARLLSALRAEIQVNAAQLDERIADAAQEIALIDSVFGAVVLPPAGVTPTPEDVTNVVSWIGPVVLQPYQRGALDDLLTSGGLPLVQDDQVRQMVLEYARMLDREAGRQENGVDFWNDHLSGYYFEHANIAGFIVAGRLGLESLPPSVGAFVNSRRFANLLAERRAIVNRLRAARVTLKEHVDSMIVLLPGG